MESLKDARHRVAKTLCESNLGIPCDFQTCGGCQRDVVTIRELQRQAMIVAWQQLVRGEAWDDGWWESYDIEALLDGGSAFGYGPAPTEAK